MPLSAAKRNYFRFVLFVFVCVTFFVAARIAGNRFAQSRQRACAESDFERGDLRSRVPYVMFRPKSQSRTSWSAEPLKKMPDGVSIPKHLSRKVWYDRERKILHFQRSLKPAEFRELFNLSADADYRSALRYVSWNLQINTLGFRSPEILPVKERNEFRFAIVGGSVSFNAPILYDPEKEINATIAGELAQVLKREVPGLQGMKVNFINAGIISAVSGQELAQLVYHLLPLNIDLLIIYDGFNDFYCPLNAYDPRPGVPYDYFVQEYRYYHYTDKHSLNSLLHRLFQKMGMAREPLKVAADYMRELGISAAPFAERKPQILEHYFANVDKMTRIASAYGIKTAVFLQPYSPRHHENDRKEVRQLLEIYAEAAGRYRALAVNNSDSLGYFDTTFLGEEMRDRFTDVAHVSGDANRHIAETMYRLMSENHMFDSLGRGAGTE